MTITKEQIEFEKWFSVRHAKESLRRNEEGDYYGWRAAYSYEGWLACRENIEAPLPQEYFMPGGNVYLVADVQQIFKEQGFKVVTK